MKHKHAIIIVDGDWTWGRFSCKTMQALHLVAFTYALSISQYCGRHPRKIYAMNKCLQRVQFQYLLLRISFGSYHPLASSRPIIADRQHFSASRSSCNVAYEQACPGKPFQRLLHNLTPTLLPARCRRCQLGWCLHIFIKGSMKQGSHDRACYIEASSNQ